MVFRAIERNEFSFGEFNIHFQCYAPISQNIDAALESLRVTGRENTTVKDTNVGEEPYE